MPEAQPDRSAPAATTAPEPLLRQLGLWSLWLIIINGMIGAGIFGTPAGAQRLAGDFSPWIFALGALCIAPIMLCFVQLSSAVSSTGGPIVYARTAFGPFVGFQIGWATYIARLTAFAANLNLLVASLSYFWPGSVGPALRIGLMLVLCAGFVWVNIVGAKTTMRSLGGLTALKLLPLLAIAGIGLFRLDREFIAAAASPPSAGDLGAAMLLVIYAYVGFEAGLVPAGESNNPQRDLPRALLLALVICSGLYVLVQVAAQRLVPDLAASERPLVDAGRAVLGPAGATIVVLGIIASVGGNLLASMFSAPRLTYRLALDAQLPSAFAAVHPKHNTPWFSVVMYGAASFGLAVTGGFVWLAVLSVFTRLLIYMTCIASMPRVRAAAIGPGVIRLPAGLVIPMVAMLVCVALLTRVSRDSLIATAVLLATGTVLYGVAWLRRGSPATKESCSPR